VKIIEKIKGIFQRRPLTQEELEELAAHADDAAKLQQAEAGAQAKGPGTIPEPPGGF
jgi:hypothetical protein